MLPYKKVQTLEGNMQDEYTTLAEAAKRLGVSKSTVSRVINRNKEKVPTKNDPIDTRLVLVKYSALSDLMSSSVKYRNVPTHDIDQAIGKADN